MLEAICDIIITVFEAAMWIRDKILTENLKMMNE